MADQNITYKISFKESDQTLNNVIQKLKEIANSSGVSLSDSFKNKKNLSVKLKDLSIALFALVISCVTLLLKTSPPSLFNVKLTVWTAEVI